MDADYDVNQIWEQSRDLGPLPIIIGILGVKRSFPWLSHEAVRYNERSAAERCNGRLKDEFGGHCVQVRGSDKVMMHLMFGMITLFVDQLLKVTWLLIVKEQGNRSKGNSPSEIRKIGAAGCSLMGFCKKMEKLLLVQICAPQVKTFA